MSTKDNIRRHFGKNAMSTVKPSFAGRFAVSGPQGNTSSSTFNDVRFPDGSTVRIIDQRILGVALSKSDDSIRETVAKIRKQHGTLAK